MERPSHSMPSPVESAPIPEVINHTPWPSQYFQHVDPHGEVFHVMVSRLSYSLQQTQSKDGHMEPALLAPEQQIALCQADQFYGDVNATSVLQESDFAPYKPKCDVILTHAIAHTPDGKPHERWPVGFRFGDAIVKTFQVTGPRRFVRAVSTLGTLRPGEAQAATQVQLSYELAFGGPHLIRQQGTLQALADGDAHPQPSAPRRQQAQQALDGLPASHQGNPIGCGQLPAAIHEADRALDQLVAPPHDEPPQRQYSAPQIEAFNQPYEGQQDYPVVGVGAVGRWWSPRLELAGTHDDHWKRSQWPKSPLDHDYRYWNCAPQDQQIDYPQGGEEIVLMNLLPAHRHPGPLRFALPTQDLQLLVRLEIGVLVFAPMNIDTVIVDMGKGVLSIVRRAVISARTKVRQLELGTWPKGTAVQLDAAMQDRASEDSRRDGGRHG